MSTDFIDDRCGVVLLWPARRTPACVERDLCLRVSGRPLLRLRDWRDELCPPAGLENLLRRLAGRIELPVAWRTRVRGVEDRTVEEWVGHCSVSQRFDDSGL